jgi:hypothetical protein
MYFLFCFVLLFWAIFILKFLYLSLPFNLHYFLQ